MTIFFFPIVPFDQPTDLLKQIIVCPLCPKVINTIFDSMSSLTQHCKMAHKQICDPSEFMLRLYFKLSSKLIKTLTKG